MKSVNNIVDLSPLNNDSNPHEIRNFATNQLSAHCLMKTWKDQSQEQSNFEEVPLRIGGWGNKQPFECEI